MISKSFVLDPRGSVSHDLPRWPLRYSAVLESAVNERLSDSGGRGRRWFGTPSMIPEGVLLDASAVVVEQIDNVQTSAFEVTGSCTSW